jgi:hypothetical protein
MFGLSVLAISSPPVGFAVAGVVEGHDSVHYDRFTVEGGALIGV